MTARRFTAARPICAAILLSAVLAGCTATPAAEPTTPAPTPSPTAPCLVGTWTTDGAALQPVYDAIPHELDYPAATIDPAASVTVSFAADGGFVFTQDVPVALSWLGHPAAVRLGGDMDGTYAASGDAIALAATTNALTVVPADDRDASALFAAATQETLTEWPVAASSFRCSADTLVLDLQTEGEGATLTFGRG